MDAIISIALRVIVPLLVIAGLCAWSYSEGVSRESDRRDAEVLKEREQADKDYEAAAEAARIHAVAVIDWKRKAENYYRQWQERLNHVNDSELSECVTETQDEKPGVVPGCMLSDDWVGLYNEAWFPDGTPGAAAGTDAAAGGPGSATPREALLNIRTNAGLCAEDRKRQRGLINLLQELEAGRARPTD